MVYRAKRTWILTVIVTLLVTSRVSVAAELPELSLTGGSSVKDAQVTCSGFLAPWSNSDKPAHRDRVPAGEYDLTLEPERPGIDPKDGRTIADHYEVPIWVFKHLDQDHPIGKIVMNCSAPGEFYDRFDHAGFTLTDAGSNNSFNPNFLSFPLHSWNSKRDLVQTNAQSSPERSADPLTSLTKFNLIKQDLSPHDDGLKMVISSKLDPAMPIDVHLWLKNRSGRCWRDEEGAAKFTAGEGRELKAFRLSRPESDPETVFIPVEFSGWCALGDSLAHVFQDGPDAEAEVTVIYTPIGGLERTKTIVYELSFDPSPLQLFIAGILGLVIGCLIHLFAIPKKERTRERLIKEAIVAMGAVLAAEAFCYTGIRLHKASMFWGWSWILGGLLRVSALLC